MSDDDGGAFTDFINTVDESGSDYTIVNTANPVKWGRLGQSILVSIVATVSLGIQAGVTNVRDAVVGVIDGGKSFIGSTGFNADIPPYLDVPESTDTTSLPGEWTGSGLIGELFVPILNAFEEDVWAASIDQFGVFGYPVAIGVILLFLYIGVRGLQEAGNRLAGGS